MSPKSLLMIGSMVINTVVELFAMNGKAADLQCTNACIKLLSTGPAPAPMRKYDPGLLSAEIKNLCPFGLEVTITGSDGHSGTAFYHAGQTRTQDFEGPNYTSIRVHTCMQPGVGEGSGAVK